MKNPSGGHASRLRPCLFGLWAGLTSLACGGHSVEQGQQVSVVGCSEGTREVSPEPCGRNGRGTLIQTCENNSFVATCEDPDQCFDTQERNTGRVCGRGGSQLELCDGGEWRETQCLEAPTCAEGTLSYGEKCLEDGRELLSCTSDGVWKATGDCEAADCEDGAERREDLACGLNHRGTKVGHCVGGVWVREQQCDDADVCVDGDTQSAGDCSRSCKNGQWWSEEGCSFCGDAQASTTSPLTVSSNEELSALSGASQIVGTLTITGDITDLSPLRQLRCAGSVYIKETTNLQDLSGLEGLVTAHLEVDQNGALTSLSGLDSFTSGRLTLRGNHKLKNLKGLSALRSPQQVIIFDNDGLQSLQGLDSLEQLDVLQVKHCPKLSSLEGMPRLSEVRHLIVTGEIDSFATSAPLEVEEASIVAPVVGLGDIRFAPNSDDISIRAPLTSLSPSFDAVEHAESISLYDGGYQDLQGLENLRSANSLQVINSPLLSLAGLQSVHLGSLEVRSEFPVTLSDANSLRASVFDLHAPSSELAGISQLEARHVTLEAIQVVDLNGFQGMSPLFLRLESAPALTSLEGLGLENLEFLSINGAALKDLVHIAGASRLSSLTLRNIPTLTNLGGLPPDAPWQSLFLGNLGLMNLESLPVGPFPLGSLTLEGNDKLMSLAGIERLQPSGDLSVRNNPALSQCLIDAYFQSLENRGHTGARHSEGNLTCAP